MRNCKFQKTRSPPDSAPDSARLDFRTNVHLITERERIMQTNEMKLTRAEAEQMLKTGLMIGACKTEESDQYLSKESGLDGISKYLIICLDSDNESVKFIREKESIKAHLRMLAWNEDEAWTIAEENTKRNMEITPISKVLYNQEPEEDFLYVITNQSRWHGAGCAFNSEALADFAKKHHTRRIVLLPSSVHEMLIVPHPETIEENLSDMVKEINDSMVEPEERLTDRAYPIQF